MKMTKKTNRLKYKEEYEILSKYTDIAINKIKEKKITHNFRHTSIQKYSGMSQSSLDGLLSKKRKFNVKHFFLFADRGVITMQDLIKEKVLGDMPKKEQIVLKKMFMKSETAELIFFLEENGVDVIEILKAHSKAIYARKLK